MRFLDPNTLLPLPNIELQSPINVFLLPTAMSLLPWSAFLSPKTWLVLPFTLFWFLSNKLALLITWLRFPVIPLLFPFNLFSSQLKTLKSQNNWLSYPKYHCCYRQQCFCCLLSCCCCLQVCFHCRRRYFGRL
jgi:hypothetical protein